MKLLLSRLLLTLSLSLVTSSLWASNYTLEDKQAFAFRIQTHSKSLLSKDDRKAHLLAQKINQCPTISCDEPYPESKLYIPNDIIFLIMDNMEPQDFGNFLITSQSSFDLAKDYLFLRAAFTKVISSRIGIEAYRKSCLLGTLPYVRLKFYDDQGLPEEAKTALHSLAIEAKVLSNKNKTFLSYLTNLRTLDVRCIDFCQHVTVLTGLTNLRSLNVASNDLSEYVTVLTSLQNLRTLNVGDNDLGEHVTVLTGLINLHTLNVSKNNSREHVIALTALQNLRTLNLDSLRGEHVPALVEKLTNLKKLTARN